MWFYFDDIPADIDKLVRFIENTRDFLGRLVHHGSAFVLELVGSIRSAWNSGSQRFIDVINRVRILSETQLEEHGLTGDELKGKLAQVAHYFGELISGGGRGILRKLFDAIDTVLDSILEVLSVPGAIKELKDLIKGALRD